MNLMQLVDGNSFTAAPIVAQQTGWGGFGGANGFQGGGYGYQ